MISSKFRKILSATLSFGLVSMFFLLSPKHTHASALGTVKIVSVTQNSAEHTSASDIANLPWAASGSNTLSIKFRFTNVGYSASAIQDVCVTPSVGSGSTHTRITSFTTTGIEHGVSDPYYYLGYSYNPSGYEDQRTDTICYGGISLTQGQSQDITFSGITISSPYKVDETITWTATMISSDSTTAGLGMVLTGPTEVPHSFEQFQPDVASGGTMTQTIKAPVLSPVTPTDLYANDSAATQVYKITNSSVYTATAGMFGLKYDNFTNDSGAFYLASEPVGTSITLHAGDGSADSGWSIASSGYPVDSSYRYVFFHKTSGTVTAGSSVNFTVNLKINNLLYHQSKMSWAVYQTGATATTDIANAAATGWSSDVPWYQRGLEVTQISPTQVIQSTETPVTVWVKRHYTGDVNVKVGLTGTCGTIGTSSPVSTLLDSGVLLTSFVFPYIDTSVETCTLSAVASGDNSGAWVAGASNTFTQSVDSLATGSVINGVNGTSTTLTSSTTPQSGPNHYSLWETMTTGQKVEYSIILLAFLTLLGAGIHQYGPAIREKIKSYRLKR